MSNMCVVVAYFIGLVDLIASLVCIFKASKLRPNTYLGLRIPSAFLTQKMWRKVNVLSGILGAINFVIIVALSLFVKCIYLIVYAVLSTILMISALGVYSRKMIELETGREEGGVYPIEALPTIKVSTKIMLFGWVITSILIALILMSRPQLSGIIAVHFNAKGRPDIFMNRDEFIVSFISINLGIMILTTSLLYSVRGIPSLKEFEAYNRSLVSVLQLISICIPSLFIYVYLALYLYNVFGVVIPIIVNVVVIFSLILALIFNIIKYAREEKLGNKFQNIMS